MKPIILFVAGVFLTALTTLYATDLILVAPGVAPPPIIVSKDASPRTRDAAVTLADYIEKISGARTSGPCGSVSSSIPSRPPAATPSPTGGTATTRSVRTSSRCNPTARAAVSRRRGR